MSTTEERLKAAEARILAAREKLQQEKARKQQIEARLRTAERKKARSLENRQKLLIGAAILNQMKTGKIQRDTIMAMLDGYLTRDHDRAAFNLPPKQDPTPQTDKE